MTNSLQQWLDEQGLTQGQLAERMGVPREKVNRVACGKEPSANFILDFWRATDTATVQRVFSEHVPA